MQIDANPFPYEFDLRKTALVLIDMQRDFIEPGGFGETLGNDVSLLEAIVRLPRGSWKPGEKRGAWWSTRARPTSPIFPTARRPNATAAIRRLRIGDEGPMGRILVMGEPGNQIIDALAPIEGEIVVDKPGKGAFYATGLHEMLKRRGITHLLFGGVTTEVCVQTSMREANDRGYDCLLLEDCTESYFPASRRLPSR